MRPGLLVTLLLLLGLPMGALAQSTDAADDGVQLVGAAGVSGRVAAALDEALRRFRLPPDADEADEERELRRAERAATEVLATEGYFSAALRFEPNAAQVPRYRLLVETGRQTAVGSVDIRFRGPLAEPAFAERVASLRRDWSLPAGAPFRSAEWEAAKNRLMLAVTAIDFAAAT